MKPGKATAVTYGGGATWLTGSYDAETDTLYWATGNPWPDSDDRERGGDNLFTNCVLALDPATGKLKWYYQFTPHDVHDWDATEPNVLVDTKYRGKDRKAPAACRPERFLLRLRSHRRRTAAGQKVHAPSDLGERNRSRWPAGALPPKPT